MESHSESISGAAATQQKGRSLKQKRKKNDQI